MKFAEALPSLLQADTAGYPGSAWCLMGAVWVPQFAFAIMHVSSHRALEHIPPFAFASIRIAIAMPFLLLSARIQVSSRHWTVQRIDYFEFNRL